MSLREQYDSGSPCRRAARRHWSVAPGNGCGEHQGQQAHDDMALGRPSTARSCLLPKDLSFVRRVSFTTTHERCDTAKSLYRRSEGLPSAQADASLEGKLRPDRSLPNARAERQRKLR
jgi:hypothetical protein